MRLVLRITLTVFDLNIQDTPDSIAFQIARFFIIVVCYVIALGHRTYLPRCLIVSDAPNCAVVEVLKSVSIHEPFAVRANST